MHGTGAHMEDIVDDQSAAVFHDDAAVAQQLHAAVNGHGAAGRNGKRNIINDEKVILTFMVQTDTQITGQGIIFCQCVVILSVHGAEEFLLQPDVVSDIDAIVLRNGIEDAAEVIDVTIIDQGAAVVDHSTAVHDGGSGQDMHGTAIDGDITVVLHPAICMDLQ